LASISGRTELDIMRESLRINGIQPSDEHVQALASALVNGYETARDELLSRGRALPGAVEVLRLLADDPGIYQSVLTGNLRAVARIKLEVFGLDRYLDLTAGAYGDDDPERPKLVAIAQARAAERTGLMFGNEDTALVGDTPKDVEAALVAGVRAIGVATGKTTAEELAQAGAHYVIADLYEAPELFSKLIRGLPGE
jgi:phosphoglycolate phosphatase-like HAD superfamily hydrolase